jgi:hypothetical protein
MPFKDPNKAREYNTRYQRRWREQNHERYRERKRKWIEENRDKVRGYGRKYYNLNKEKEITRIVIGNLNRYRKMRLDAILHYGGDPPKCFCCGEQEYQFLTIHHLENNAAAHRREMKGKYYWGIYEFLKRSNYPGGYGVACYNCNSAIGHYGVCPHHASSLTEAGHTPTPAAILPLEETEPVDT